MTIFARTVVTDAERIVDPVLGYPRGYAKLCRHAYIQAQGLITPFTQGPPQRFHPYAPQDDEIAKLKEYEDLFPLVDEGQRDPVNPKKHIEFLWQQMDHLGNAGFDPDKFRIDVYGNVLYKYSDAGSPLAWEIDYWFPHSRGGRTVPSNLRLVQWQVNHRKKKNLEFLVPWWDLQVGVSVNQFLSAFASKNVDFRQRAFSFFFPDGESEILGDNEVVENHSWPHRFRERKNKVGLAAAAIVKMQKDMDGALKSLNSNTIMRPAFLHGSLMGNKWTLEEEEEAVRRDIENFGLGDWKGIKEKMDKDNKTLAAADKYFTTSAAIQNEQKLRQSMEETKKHKVEEVARLEEELQMMKDENVKEKAMLDDLEQTLLKQKRRVEKQRRWSETQSQYRLCLEKMIRDTLHQCVVYKEQARLNQAACNALLARLESQKSTCDAAEMDLARKVKQREELEALVRPKITKRYKRLGNTDVNASMKFNLKGNPADFLHKSMPVYEEEDSNYDDYNADEALHPYEGQDSNGVNDVNKIPASVGYASSRSSKLVDIEAKKSSQPHEIKLPSRGKALKGIKEVPCEMSNRDTEPKANHGYNQHADEPNVSPGYSGTKRKALDVSESLDVVLIGYEYGQPKQVEEEVEREESVGDNGTTDNNDDQEQNDFYEEADYEDNNQYNEEYEVAEEEEEEEEEAEEEGVEEEEQEEEEDDYSEYAEEENENEGYDHVEPENENEDEVAGNHVKHEYVNPKSVSEKSGDLPTKDEEQLDELLEEVLQMQGKVNAAMVEAIREEEDEEERMKKMGKLNLDKWLQKLLLETGYAENKAPNDMGKPDTNTKKPDFFEIHKSGKHVAFEVGTGEQQSNKTLKNEKPSSRSSKNNGDGTRNSAELGMKNRNDRNVGSEMKAAVGGAQYQQHGGSELVGGIIGGLWKKLSNKTTGMEEANLDGKKDTSIHSSNNNTNSIVKKGEDRKVSPWRWVVGTSPAFRRSASAGRLSPWRRNQAKDAKAEERRVIESFSKMKLGVSAVEPMKEPQKQGDWQSTLPAAMIPSPVPAQKGNNKQNSDIGGRGAARKDSMMMMRKSGSRRGSGVAGSVVVPAGSDGFRRSASAGGFDAKEDANIATRKATALFKDIDHTRHPLSWKKATYKV